MAEIILRKYADSDESAMKDMMAREDNCHYIKDLNSCDKLTIAEYGKVTVGYLWLSIAKDNCQAYIYVSPEYRRRGIGKTLCRDAEQQCREKGEPEIWGYYYDETVKEFADKIGCYFTTAHIDMEYTGGILQEPEITHNIRRCKSEDYERSQYLWNNGMHEMRMRVGYPYSKPYEPTEEDRQGFVNDLDNNFVLEEGGQIVGYGAISSGTIGAIAVNKDMNNKGYGTAVAIFLTNEILKRGHSVVYSACEAENINSRRVHEKIGYKVTNTAYSSFKKVE